MVEKAETKVKKIKKRIEQDLPDCIENSDLEYLQIRTTSEVFNEAVRYAMKICPEMGISYDDFLYTMKVKESPHGQYWLTKADVWANASESQREAMLMLEPDLNVDKLELIIREFNERQTKLAGMPVNLAMALHVKGYDNPKHPGWQVTEFREVIRHALYGDKERDEERGKYEEHMELIRYSEYQVLTEIFFRVFLKPAKAYENCFFFNLYTGLLRASVPLLNIMMPENQSLPIEKLVNV